MLNQLVLVGRTKEITPNSLAITISGHADPVIVKFTISEQLGVNVMENLTPGCLVGVKGHIEGMHPAIELIADKITFLSNKESGETNEEV